MGWGNYIGGGIGLLLGGPAGAAAGYKYGDDIGNGIASGATDAYHLIKPIADPATGYNTAAGGARKAQDDYAALAQLQWQRAMEAITRANGMMDPQRQLYDRVYGANLMGSRPQSAGGGMPAPPHFRPQQPAPPPATAQQFQQPPQGRDMGGYESLMRRNGMG